MGIVRANLFVLSFCAIFFSSSAHTEEIQNRLGATFGASYEYGQLGDSGMGLQNRAMGAEDFEVLAGYRTNSKWLVGLDLQYRFQQQLSTLGESGGTNLAGRGYLFGIGAKYDFSPTWSLQGAIDFSGRYDFDRATDQQQSDHLHSPIALRLKGQYFFRQDCPLSIDGIVDYQSWSKFHVAGTDHSNPASQWMLGVGLTYHFGKSDSQKIESPATPTTIESQDPNAGAK